MALTNQEWLASISKMYPNWQAHTAKVTNEVFTENGFERIKNTDRDALDEMWGLIVRTALQVVNISHVKDILEENGFGEYFDQPFGGYIQRMAVQSVKPVSPAYLKLEDGKSIDPFVIRKAKVSDRFFRYNFEYQSLLTMPDDFQLKRIFISDFGISEFVAGMMEGLQNGYTLQVYLNKLEAINAGLNSTTDPLLPTQVVQSPLDANLSAQTLTAFILLVKNVVSLITMSPQSGAYNALGFKSTQDTSRLKLLVRPGIKNAISVNVLTTAFNPENLNLPVDVIEVPNFGGLVPYAEQAYTTQLYPVYDELGVEIGFSATEGQIGETNVTYTEDNVFWKDPNANIDAILADKGWIFHSRQNPYEVEPIRNPRGRYTNYWASSPHNAISVDPLYNVVVFQRAAG